MLNFIEVASAQELDNEFEQLYTNAFPADERRSIAQLIDAIQNPFFSLQKIYFQNKLIGFISIWLVERFTFIEHFAILASERGNGYGSLVMQQILNRYKYTILEVEEPFDSVNKKRISFYKRLSFHLNNADYFQPAYSSEKQPVKMLLMSYPDKIKEHDIKKIMSLIHQTVYQKSS